METKIFTESKIHTDYLATINNIDIIQNDIQNSEKPCA